MAPPKQNWPIDWSDWDAAGVAWPGHRWAGKSPKKMGLLNGKPTRNVGIFQQAMIDYCRKKISFAPKNSAMNLPKIHAVDWIWWAMPVDQQP